MSAARTPEELKTELTIVSVYSPHNVGLVVNEALSYIEDLEKTIKDMEDTVEFSKQLRPIWAKGYTSDSIAAQASSSALVELWEFLGVDNQTAACDKMRELKEKGLI